jgi:CheY-like chemotaxis protein
LKLPGIALSGYGQETDIQQSHEAGFVAHLTKPVALPKLEEAIAKVVGDGIRIAGGGQEEDIG